VTNSELDIEHAIEQWSDCVRGSITAGLGYPQASTEHRAIHGRGGRAPDWPALVNEIELAVCAMSKPYKRAIKLTYVYRLSLRTGSKFCHCSVNEFRSRLESAKAFVAGRLSALKSA